jgi:hypothetical protein
MLLDHPVYILTLEDDWRLGNIDAIANQEDDVPPNGNPHPLQKKIMMRTSFKLREISWIMQLITTWVVFRVLLWVILSGRTWF